MAEENNMNEEVEDTDDVSVESFKAYPSSDDGRTKTVDGETHLESFRMYKGKDEEHSSEDDTEADAVEVEDTEVDDDEVDDEETEED